MDKVLMCVFLIIASLNVWAANHCTYSVLERDSLCKRLDAMGFEREYICHERILYQFSYGREVKGSPTVFKGCYRADSPNYSPYCTGPTVGESYIQMNQFINRSLAGCTPVAIERAFGQNQ